MTQEKKYHVPLSLKDRALSSASEGITISDRALPDNPLIYANKGFEYLTGYSVESVLGRNCRFLQGPDTDPATAQEIREAITQEKPCTVEILNYRKDGTTFWNRLSITPVKDDNGKTTHFIGVQSDITNRRKAEDALRTAKENLETANTKMKSDLSAAAKIQQALLPDVLPGIEGLNFAWQFSSCDELAGDFLNVVQLDDTHIGLYIVDVSGHGVQAALLSVTLSHTLMPLPGQSILYRGTNDDYTITSPHQVGEQLNKQFQFDERTNQFFTMIYGVYDVKTHEFEYFNAGHPPMIYIHTNENSKLLESSGFPVGVSENPGYESTTLRLEKGDSLVLYTDGITEALNESEKAFGTRRVLDILNSEKSNTLNENLIELLRTVKQWCGDVPQLDDMSLLAMKREK